MTTGSRTGARRSPPADHEPGRFKGTPGYPKGEANLYRYRDCRPHRDHRCHRHAATALTPPRRGCSVGLAGLGARYDRKQLKDAPSIGTDGELLAADEEAVFQHY